MNDTDKRAQALRARWASVPGVSYPEAPKTKPAPKRKPKDYDASRWMSTDEAAGLLGIGRPAAYLRLNRAGVESAKCGSERLWRREEVKRLLRALPKTLAAVPEGWLTAQEAMSALGVPRHALSAAERRCELHPRKVRLLAARCGNPEIRIYSVAEVEKMKNALKRPRTPRYAPER